jgi:hypothetical protein
MTPTIYLCGPIFNCTPAETYNWREEVKQRFSEVALFVDPCDWTGKKVVSQDLHAIAQCQAVLANCWKPSYGSAMEVFHAYHNDKYVSLVSPRPLSPWLEAHCHNHSPNPIVAAERIIQCS